VKPFALNRQWGRSHVRLSFDCAGRPNGSSEMPEKRLSLGFAAVPIAAIALGACTDTRPAWNGFRFPSKTIRGEAHCGVGLAIVEPSGRHERLCWRGSGRWQPCLIGFGAIHEQAAGHAE
jgi:hypothetical protein